MNDVTDMTSQVDEHETDAEEGETPDELTVLKDRARTMGLKVSPNIGLEALRAKINAALTSSEPTPPEPASMETVAPAAAAPLSPGAQKALRRRKLHEQHMRLVRIRVTCMNPDKRDWPGEIFTFSNKYLGIVRKYVPFGEATDNGYHVPHVIYEQMKERRFLQKKTRPDPKNPAQIHVETRWVPEFSIEVMDQLTEDELKRLALQQAAAAGMAE